MMNTHLDEKKTVPLWAAIGVPLLGVPIMVALLALTTAVERPTSTEPDMGVRTEQVELLTVEKAIEGDVGCLERDLQRG